jgi:hypothetical protein
MVIRTSAASPEDANPKCPASPPRIITGLPCIATGQ